MNNEEGSSGKVANGTLNDGEELFGADVLGGYLPLIVDWLSDVPGGGMPPDASDCEFFFFVVVKSFLFFVFLVDIFFAET